MRWAYSTTLLSPYKAGEGRGENGREERV